MVVEASDLTSPPVGAASLRGSSRTTGVVTGAIEGFQSGRQGPLTWTVDVVLWTWLAGLVVMSASKHVPLHGLPGCNELSPPVTAGSRHGLKA